MTLGNNCPYIFFWNPNPTGKSAPTLPSGLQTWAPYRLNVKVKNDTAFKAGINDHLGTGRNVPFVPYINRHAPADNSAGGYINMSLYGTYMTATDVTLLRGGTHYGNWFYGMPNGATPLASTNDGYYYELHGTYQFSKNALITFLNMPSATADARVWFAANVGVGGAPAGSGTITSAWRSWLWENYSQAGSTLGGGAGNWNDTVTNGNIYTDYEFDMAGSLGLYVSMKLDNVNYTNANQLAIRVYMMGWGPDAAIIRMMEQANMTGSLLNTGKGYWLNGWYYNRAPLMNYAEDVFLNASISPRMANSSFRGQIDYSMLGWEDDSTTVWAGGWQLPLGAHADYIPNDFAAPQTTYPSPFDKYAMGGGNDIASGDQTKSYMWRGAGSVRFGMNASVCLVTPQIRNLTAYEAIIVDLNILSSPWLAGLKTKFGGGAVAMTPYLATTMTINPGKIAELTGHLYMGTVKLGKANYPGAAILNGYNPVTKILNLSGGTTGMAMPHVFNVDYWGGNTRTPNEIYIRSQPQIQIDVSPVDHYTVTVQPGPYVAGQNYWVKVVGVNATGWVPKEYSGLLIGNETIRFTTNNPGTLWNQGNGSTAKTFTLVNGTVWNTVRFGTAKANTYVNVTGQWFNYTVGGGALTQSTIGSSGLLSVLIPEFATVLIPIVGMMAIFFVFRIRKRKREE
jgi:hypothetical protein